MQVKHYGYIDSSGKLMLSNPESFKQELINLKERNVFVVVGDEKPTRSNNQNRYYWSVVLGLLSEHTGYTPDEMHEVLLQKFSVKKEVKIGDETHFIKSRSHKMKTDEFQEYLEKIRLFAATELNIIIPLPGEILQSEDEKD